MCVLLVVEQCYNVFFITILKCNPTPYSFENNIDFDVMEVSDLN